MSRQSFTQQTDNFGILLQLLTTITNYSPNEDELKLINLTPYQSSLMDATKAVDQTEAEINSKLIERNQLLYAVRTGLYSIAQNVKKYVKSVYGATSPEYSNVSKIKFTIPK
jgi:predicted NodU family carbamoyl transferase